MDGCGFCGCCMLIGVGVLVVFSDLPPDRVRSAFVTLTALGVAGWVLSLLRDLLGRGARGGATEGAGEGAIEFNLAASNDVDWTDVPVHPNGVARTGEVAYVDYDVTGSTGNPYSVSIMRSGTRAWAVCTCPAGKKRFVCKHRTLLYEHAPALVDFLRGTELGAAWEHYAAVAAEPGAEETEEYQRARWALRDAMRPPRGFAKYRN